MVELENIINQKGFTKQEGFGRDGALHTVAIIIDTRSNLANDINLKYI